MLRDSLAAVQGGAARLQRDLANSSDAVTRTRSREISDACASSARASKSVQQTVATNPEPAKDAKQTRAGVIATLRELRTALDQCHADFARLSDPVMAEELRGYGVSRAERLDQPIGRYNLALAEYLGAVDIILPLQSISPEAH